MDDWLSCSALFGLPVGGGFVGDGFVGSGCAGKSAWLACAVSIGVCKRGGVRCGACCSDPCAGMTWLDERVCRILSCCRACVFEAVLGWMARDWFC